MRLRVPKPARRRFRARRSDGLNKSEGQMLSILRGLKLDLVPQAKIGKYTVDFLLPDYKVVVEVDGGPYHTLPDDARRGEVRDKFLRENGYLPVHTWTSTLHEEGGRAKIVKHILGRMYRERGIIIPGHSKFYRKQGYDPDAQRAGSNGPV